MSGVELKEYPGLVEMRVPLVLAVASYGADTECERFIASLAHTGAESSGRVLVVEYGSHKPQQGELVRQGFEDLPGNIYRDAYGVFYTSFADLTHPDIYVALESISGAPARFDLLLLRVNGGSEEELFLASLAQRVVVVSGSEETDLQSVAVLMQKLSLQHEQHHFTLVVDDTPEVARSFYRLLFDDYPGLLNVDCDLQDEVSASFLKSKACTGQDVVTGDGRALLDMFGQLSAPIKTDGSLKLFWKSAMFCSECSIKLCRKVLSAEHELEVCPLQKF